MSFIEVLLIGVGLAMDAFAVSICKGLAMKKLAPRSACIIGLWFGGFQALMPFIGWVLGTQFESYITAIDHWIAFILLGFIGGNMLREAFGKDEDEKTDDSISFKTMLLLAVATSIDALAVGITFAFLKVNIFSSIAVIGAVTFFIAVAGVAIGHAFGLKFKKKAEILGGVILILIGLKILIEHLFFGG